MKSVPFLTHTRFRTHKCHFTNVVRFFGWENISFWFFQFCFSIRNASKRFSSILFGLNVCAAYLVSLLFYARCDNCASSGGDILRTAGCFTPREREKKRIIHLCAYRKCIIFSKDHFIFTFTSFQRSFFLFLKSHCVDSVDRRSIQARNRERMMRLIIQFSKERPHLKCYWLRIFCCFSRCSNWTSIEFLRIQTPKSLDFRLFNVIRCCCDTFDFRALIKSDQVHKFEFYIRFVSSSSYLNIWCTDYW